MEQVNTSKKPPLEPLFHPQYKLMLTTIMSQCSCCKQQEKYNTTLHWFHSLPFQQFQVLFNSLFKVLCIFPSRYLCAIGLPPIFSFRRNLPPNLIFNPKKIDSLKQHAEVDQSRQEREFHPLSCPIPRDLVQNNQPMSPLQTTIRCASPREVTQIHNMSWIPLQSPLLGESQLVSFPPLNYMLKFSGYSYLI